MKKTKIKQISIFEIDINEDLLEAEEGLTELENEIKRYVYLHFKGKSNGIPMKDLAERFNISEREVRDVMANVTEKSIIDFDSGPTGYFACKPGERRDSHRIKRAIRSVRRIINGNPEMLKLFYNELNTIRDEL